MSIRLKLCLASASPRRRELLAQIHVNCIVQTPDVLEQHRRGESGPEYALRLSREKALQVQGSRIAESLESLPILAADTVVVIGEDILEKPVDEQDAKRMLRCLSGNTHEVLTGFTIINNDHLVSGLSRSRVTFARLSDAEIQRYWNTGEPADKAGAYGIQGYAARFISRVEGSYSGVVGLPLFEITEALKQMGLLEA